ncbi:CDP-diacylglycerol--serine O-phosphatidyltransferase [Bacteroidales bacterium OttesenSCG-928-I21]|nr:CDP-diacylglycerol--serine O-phosphatidyltransferase [Bacteroidales bacterium OttesenSCG-928-I21]
MIRFFLKSLPSFITSLNLLCGAIASIFALKGEIHIAIYLILLAAVFDFFDGFVARLVNSVSEFGKQLDSLADVISFGFAPASMLYFIIESNDILPGYWSMSAIVIVVFSALRLAKFNIDTEQSIEFRGLPTPAAALLIISICWYCADYSNAITDFILNKYFIVALIITISALMVSRIKLFSLKIKSFSFKTYIWQIILILLAIPLLITFQILGIGLVIILYISLSILKQFFQN